METEKMLLAGEQNQKLIFRAQSGFITTEELLF